MIKGSTKVGEVFICGLDSDGTLEVLPQYLGKAITGLGGGCDQMFVIEEDEGFLGVVSALQPRAAGNQYREGELIGQENGKEPPFRNNTHDGNRPSGRKHQALAHQKFGMTPFDQQQQQQNQVQNPNGQNMQNNPLALVDQKIEERESLRHSTHRSQRSERLSQQQQQQKGAGGQFHQTTSDRFDNTEYSDNNGTGMGAQAHGGQQNNQFLQQNGYATSMTNQQNNEEKKLEEGQNAEQPNVAQQNTTGQETSEDPHHQTGGNSTWQQQQAQRNTSTNLKRGLSNTQQHENMGRLQQIQCGKDHTLNLTRDGDVFSHGVGTFCAAGHGGSRAAEKPQILKPLRDKRVIQIACGEHHSLVLTDKGYLYAWGRGFEGQLGISNTIEVASTPSFVKHFHKKSVASIAAGSFHSIAITDDGDLYTWGEGKMGQLGIGCVRIKRMPEQVHFDFEEDQNSNETEKTRIMACSAGFGHTAALAQDGSLYMWGFNVYGQLGVGDKKTRWNPERIIYSNEGQELPLFSKVACSKYATYAIDQLGQPYSWGKGYTGHTGSTMHDLPKLIETNTENRIFTDVFANSDSALLYSPIRVFQIEPKCGPSRGGTIIKIVGTGFVESNQLRVRFTYGALSREVSCTFDQESRSLVCRTPVFQEFEGEGSGLQMPCDCFLSVTMDGINYSECEEPFKIYSNEIYLTTINPKCGSVSGGTKLTLGINIDEVTASSIETLKIGFQAKKATPNAQVHNPRNRGNNDSRLQQSPQFGNGADEFSQGEWICTEGIYANGLVTATVPHLESFQADNMSYLVDVALNGQQFTGRAVSFRYYDIEVERIEPDFGPHEGGTNIVICGRGLYDASIKRIQFETDGCEGMREVTADWDRKDRAIRCTVPPLSWMFNGGEAAEGEEAEQKVEDAEAEGDAEEVKSGAGGLTEEQIRQRTIAEKPIRIRITFNNQEWIDAKSFRYHDVSLSRAAFAHMFAGPLDATQTQEERDAAWLAEEAEVVPVEEQTQNMTDDERKKRDEEKKKQEEERIKTIAAETEEVTTLAKRKGFKVFLHGTGFMQTGNLLSIRFSYNGGEVEREVAPVYKNSKLLGVALPDMGEAVPIGPHMLNVELTLNGQQYTSSGIQVLFNQVDPNLTDEELRKMDEDEAKNQKKKPGKK